MLTHLELCKLFSIQRSLKNGWFSAKGIIMDGVFFCWQWKVVPLWKKWEAIQKKRVKQSLHLSINSYPTGSCANVNAHQWGQLLQLMDIRFSHYWVRWELSASAILHCHVAFFLRWLSYLLSIEKGIEKKKCAMSPQVHVVVFVSKPMLFLNKKNFSVIANKNWNLSENCCNN